MLAGCQNRVCSVLYLTAAHDGTVLIVRENHGIFSYHHPERMESLPAEFACATRGVPAFQIK